MQVSQIQSPQYNTLGKLPPLPEIGSLSVYSELQITHRLRSPLIKNVSKFLRLPPNIA